MTLATRTYRVLLHLYPVEFRERYGGEMAATFEAELAFRRASGPRATAKFLTAAAADLASTVFAERSTTLRADSTRQKTFSMGELMRSIGQDVRFAVRSLRRRPGFTCGVILTLALGIGATTSIFTLIDTVLLRPVPVLHPESVVAVYETATNGSPTGTSFQMIRNLQTSARTLDGVAGFVSVEVGVRAHGAARRATAASVSGSYFSLLGVRSQAGRLLGPSDDNAVGANPVAVLSDELWATEFGRSASAVGSVIQIGGQPFTVIGVAPPEFHGTRLGRTPHLWVPLTMLTSVGAGGFFAPKNNASIYGARGHLLSLVARLKPGVSVAAATADVSAVAASSTASAAPVRRLPPGVQAAKWAMRVMPIAEAAAMTDRTSLVRFVGMLLGVVTLTLLIACINVGNLLVIRSTERAREIAVRIAIGAGRARIARALLIENFLLALAAAGVGIGIAIGTGRLLDTYTLPGKIAIHSVHRDLDHRVLLFALLLGACTALIFGVVPALRATAVDPMAELKTRGGARPRTPRGLLITAQVAMSLTLLVGAALFIRSLRAGLTTDIGFDPRPLSAVSIEPGLTGSTKERTQWFYANVLGEAQRIRGVTGVAISDHVPLADVLSLGFTTGAPAQMPALGADSKEAGITTITPEFFEVLGIPLIAGRPFSTADRADGPKVAMLNESASRLFFGERSPLGHTVNFLGAMSYTVIGVVRDIKYESVRDDRRPMVYFSMSQESVGAANVIVRSRDPKSALAGLRRTLAAVDPNVPTHDGRAVADQIDEVLMPQRFGSTLLGAFAIIALLVSVVGIYGVIAYIVAQRSSEIGIRIALGAQAADVLRLVLANTGIAVAVGFVVGMGGAAIASRALSRFLFGVGALDATAFVVAGAAFAAAAIAATVVPARRAVRVDPASAMRSD